MNHPNRSTPNKPHFFAEVTESSLQTFTAQSWEWDYFPAFGSLVTVQTINRTVLGIVYAIQTGSSDPHRSPFTYKKVFLRVIFRALIK